MDLLDWFYRFISFFGVRNKQAKILILGLNKTGKSTLLKQMAYYRPGLRPNLYPTSEELVVDNVRFVAIDVGEQIWSEYLYDVAGIIFLVDTTDYMRFDKVEAELNVLLAMKETQAIPIVVLGNKIDRLEAVSEEEPRYELGLEHIYDRPIALYMCSLASRQGYGEALRFLEGHI
ncbi:GTP-binding protein SAR1 [Xylaria digitata]|nr:GTP-binding protein SAR1 [Xylaria digitata]